MSSLDTIAANNGQKNKLALKSQERCRRTRQALCCRPSWKPNPVVFCWSWTRRKWSLAKGFAQISQKDNGARCALLSAIIVCYCCFNDVRFDIISIFPKNKQNYGDQESSTRCNFRKHMQIEKAPANPKKKFIILTADGANAHNTNK